MTERAPRTDRTPTTAVVSFRDIRPGPWNAHAFALTDLVAEAFGATTLVAREPSSATHRGLAGLGKRLDLVRRLPGRARLEPAAAPGAHDLLFVVAHDATDLDLLFAAEADWLDTRAFKILVLVEVWERDARRWPESYRRVLPHFDAVFCTLEEGIDALSEVSGTHVEVMAQAVDVLNAPFSLDPRLDVLTIGRRAPLQHQLIERWAAEHDGWHHYDTLPAGITSDVDLHRRVTATTLSRSAVSICNYARFDDVDRIGSTHGTGTRFFETLASGALIAGDLPTDPMFHDQFDGAEGVVSFPMECSDLGTDAVAELVAKGRDPRLRRSNRLHALGHQDLAHRLRQILAHVGLAEPPLLVERFARLDDERRAVLDAGPTGTSPIVGLARSATGVD